MDRHYSRHARPPFRVGDGPGEPVRIHAVDAVLEGDSDLCTATAGDLVITAIAFSAAAIAGGLHWPLILRRFGPGLIFLTAGILLTIGYEIYALSAGRWAYDERMPVIFGIGLTPLLQWIVIPPLEIAAFRLIWRGATIDKRLP